MYKTLAIAALAASVWAQDPADNATAAEPDLATVLSENEELSNLTTYLMLFPDLVAQLGQLQNVTVLAPNNDAFAAFLNSSMGEMAANDTELIQAVLMYHVLNGSFPDFGNETQFIPTALMSPEYTNVTGGQVVQAVPGDDGAVEFFSGFVSQANTTGEPLNFTGGVIHVIDNLLVIPGNVSATAVEANLTYAVGALTRAELAETVSGLEDVTLFVPSNDAFDAIGNLVGNLTVEQLTEILTYHAVEGTVGYSTTLENGTTLTTVNGEDLTIRIIDDAVFVNQARVIVPDVLVANGVVHVIDGVLNPANATAEPNPDDEESLPAFEGAEEEEASDLGEGVPTPTGTSTPTADAPGATSTENAGPMKTAAIGVAALFGGAAVLLNA